MDWGGRLLDRPAVVTYRVSAGRLPGGFPLAGDLAAGARHGDSSISALTGRRTDGGAHETEELLASTRATLTAAAELLG